MKFLKQHSICVLVLLSISGENEANEFTDIFLTTNVMPYLFRVATDVLSSDEISLNCTQSLTDVATGISEKKLWAIKMLDSMGKLPSGILEGSVLFPGSYTECLKIVTDDNVKAPFQGQFCNFVISFNQPNSSTSEIGDFDLLALEGTISGIKILKHYLKLQWSACFPSTCNTIDITNALTILASSMGLPINFSAETCEIESKPQLDNAQIVSITIFAALLLLILSGTVLDVSFILLEKLKAEGEIKKGNAIYGLDETKTLSFQLLVSSYVSVDVFFFLSGLLVTYVVLNEMKKRGNLNWGIFYVHRLWRLTPALALVILFSFLMPLFGSGIFWKSQWESTTTACKAYWWTSLLYFSNFIPDNANPQCMDHGWYLAVDMQFYIISPLILYMLWRWPIGGLILNTLFLVVTSVIPAWLMMANDYVPSPLPVFDKKANDMHMSAIYKTPYCRMGPYCIGIYVGYLLASKKIVKINLSMQIVCWCLSIASCTAVVFGTYQWMNEHPSPKEVNALFVATHRTAFTLGIAWMIYACCTGYGGIINRILSWKAFTPLGRMTYMAYLLHPYIIFSLNWMLQERIIFSHFYMVTTFFGFLVMGYFLAFLTSIAFETPFMNLEKILLTKVKGQQREMTKAGEQQPEIITTDNANQENLDYKWIKEEKGHVNMAFVIERTRL